MIINKLSDINSKEVILLQKEAGLAATSIEQGMTVLRKAGLSQKWFYYQSFFLLSIGIERLLKLILIVKKVVETNSIMTNNDLKTYNHNIEGLFKTISKELRPNENFLNENKLYAPILSFLSNFASNSRYYNLDSLTGVSKSNDPIHEWNKIQVIIKTEYCNSKLLSKNDKKIVSMMNNNSIILLRDENDMPINDFESYFNNTKRLDNVQGYSILFVYNIINYIISILFEISEQKRMLPEYREFFPLFQNQGMTDKTIRNRKNWNFLETRR